MKNTSNTGTPAITRAQRARCFLKAAAAATVMLPVAYLLVMLTPFGFFAAILVGVFVLEPLDSLGFVDLGESTELIFVPNYLALTLMAVPFWLLFFWLFFILFWARAEKAAALEGAPSSSSVVPETLLNRGPVDAIDSDGRKLSVGDRVVIRAVASCLKELTKEERARLRALVGIERSIVDLDRFGFVWLSFSASNDNADFCLSSRDVARVQ
jgi:hypothetical protein